MVSFILNDKHINTEHPPGMTLLDFIRYDENLPGAKIGCREGDCGACTVIEGQLINGRLFYKTIVSCLTPLGNVNGKHIVTVEGINMKDPSPVQNALIENNGTQCGFCTPGFVISLTAFLLSNEYGFENARAAMDGNICRCTGYKSIERAALEISNLNSECKSENKIDWLVEKGFIPAYFMSIQERLNQIKTNSKELTEEYLIVGGGTDLMVQKPDEVYEQQTRFVLNKKKEITIENNYCSIDGEATASDIMQSKELQKYFPNLQDHFKLISSTPIRNMGTLAGNIVNASPIGDLSIFFLGLDAEVILSNQGNKERKIKLKDFFLAYKKLELRKGELLKAIMFRLPAKTDYFNFEKVSKRQFLDIASVNSAISMQIEEEIIEDVHISAGGVGPIPIYLEKTSAFLKGKEISIQTLTEANNVLQSEISPISDIRGSAAYKKLLIRQLFFAHFIRLFPNMLNQSELLNSIKA